MPKDGNAFLRLDISGMTPLAYKVTQVDAPAASTDANLADLKIGALTLSPAFACRNHHIHRNHHQRLQYHQCNAC